MSDLDHRVLAAVLDTIIPATPTLAGAGGLNLGSAVMDDAQAIGASTTVAEVLAGLPEDFPLCPPSQREEILQTAESRDPSAVKLLVNLVYTAYYTDPRVLTQIESTTGYNAGPPQPKGYSLTGFGATDEALLAPVRAMDPFWRNVP